MKNPGADRAQLANRKRTKPLPSKGVSTHSAEAVRTRTWGEGKGENTEEVKYRPEKVV